MVSLSKWHLELRSEKAVGEFLVTVGEAHVRGTQVGGAKRKPGLLERREQLVKRWADLIISELGGHVEEDTGFHPKCSKKPLMTLSLDLHGLI